MQKGHEYLFNQEVPLQDIKPVSFGGRHRISNLLQNEDKNLEKKFKVAGWVKSCKYN